MFIKPKNIDMTKKLYEYELISTDKDEEYNSSRNYYFKHETAKEHNRQYAINDVPRKLVLVEGGEVVEKPEWWSGTIK